jgi:predicted negative regulator of RcsB-dependent stress response
MKSFGIGFVCFILGIFFAAAVGDKKKNEMSDFIEVYKGYLEVLDRVAGVAKDPQSSKVVAVFTANEVLKSKTPEESAQYYESLLSQTSDEVVQRAIRMQLANLYKDAKQTDKALEELRVMIQDTPASLNPPKVE